MSSFLSIFAVASGLRRGDFTAVELAEGTIARLEASELGVLANTLPEHAREAAAASDARLRGGAARPLEGIPFGIKDIVAVAGAPTTYGSSGYQDFESGVTATVVRRLMDAGAIPVAKLRTYEFAAGPNDLTANPADQSRMSGGSSSGSAAAVGAGLLPFAVGTDSGGSVRVPAAWCGAVGIKPTYGWVSRHAVAPLSWTLDHVGFLTIDALDCLLLLDAVAGRDPLDPYSSDPLTGQVKDLGDIRVGVPWSWFSEVTRPDVVAQVELAAQRLSDQGFDVFEVEIPELGDLNVDIVKHVLVAAEAASVHDGPLDAYCEAFGNLLAIGRRVLAVDYARALRGRSVIQEAVVRVLSDCDFLLTPGSPITAPVRGTQHLTVRGRQYKLGNLVARCTSLFDITGHPAITVPSGVGADGMPVGVQVVGGFWNDRQMVQVAARLAAEQSVGSA